jgi:hypothetical protein
VHFVYVYSYTDYHNIFFLRFLGLPKVKYLEEANKHETNSGSIEKDHLLNDTARIMLENFYEPFNQLLVEFMFDLGNQTSV